MESPDSYLTIASQSKTAVTIKGSRFIGQAIPCPDELEAERILEVVRREYHDATHNCFAYRVGLGGDARFRYSDAGEPSGTAGKPIYDRIESNNLTNVIVVVTRYFGGTKLGTGGLTHAYSESAAKAIEEAGIVERYIMEDISVTIQFSDYNLVERLIHRHEGRVVHSDFAEVVRLTIEMRKSIVEQFKSRLTDQTSGRIKFE